MNEKREETEENLDRIEWLKCLYAEWREKHWPEELFEIEEYIVDEPNGFDLESPW